MQWLLTKDWTTLVAQCSATPATVAATPPCSATPFQTQISVRHLPGQGGCTSILRPVAQDVRLLICSLWRCSSGSSTCSVTRQKDQGCSLRDSSQRQRQVQRQSLACISTSDPTIRGPYQRVGIQTTVSCGSRACSTSRLRTTSGTAEEKQA